MIKKLRIVLLCMYFALCSCTLLPHVNPEKLIGQHSSVLQQKYGKHNWFAFTFYPDKDTYNWYIADVLEISKKQALIMIYNWEDKIIESYTYTTYTTEEAVKQYIGASIEEIYDKFGTPAIDTPIFFDYIDYETVPAQDTGKRQLVYLTLIEQPQNRYHFVNSNILVLAFNAQGFLTDVDVHRIALKP